MGDEREQGGFSDTDAAIDRASIDCPLTGADVIRLVEGGGRFPHPDLDDANSEPWGGPDECPSALLPLIAEAIAMDAEDAAEGDSGHTSLSVAREDSSGDDDVLGTDVIIPGLDRITLGPNGSPLSPDEAVAMGLDLTPATAGDDGEGDEAALIERAAYPRAMPPLVNPDGSLGGPAGGSIDDDDATTPPCLMQLLVGREVERQRFGSLAAPSETERQTHELMARALSWLDRVITATDARTPAQLVDRWEAMAWGEANRLARTLASRPHIYVALLGALLPADAKADARGRYEMGFDAPTPDA